MGKSQVDGLIIPQDPSPPPGAKVKSSASRARSKSNRTVEGKAQGTNPNSTQSDGRKKIPILHKRGTGWVLSPWENKTPPATQYEFTGGEGRAERVQKEDSANCWSVPSLEPQTCFLGNVLFHKEVGCS